MKETTHASSRDSSEYFKAQHQRRERKKEEKRTRSRKRRRIERIIWTLVLVAFIASLIRIVPKIIANHNKGPAIKTRKM
jgi:hypothetical protein